MSANPFDLLYIYDELLAQVSILSKQLEESHVWHVFLQYIVSIVSAFEWSCSTRLCRRQMLHADQLSSWVYSPSDFFWKALL